MIERFQAAAVSFCLLLSFIPPAATAAEDPTPPGDMAEMLKQMSDRMAAQEKRIAELEAKLADKNLREIRKQELVELLKEINADAAKRTTLPDWMENLTFSGDFRLRYQGEHWNDKRNTDPRNRGRIRLRFGLVKTWLDGQVEVGFRLATGEPGYKDRSGATVQGYSDGTSTNQTLGVYWTEKPIWVDLAYATYKPNWAKGLAVTAGKMKNPFVVTELVWDSDINPEGAAVSYTCSRFGKDFQPFMTAGYFVVNENSTGSDVDLWAYQAGFTWKVVKNVQWTLAAAYYDYDQFERANIFGNGNDQAAGTNFYLAEKFQSVDLINKVAFDLFGLPWAVAFDWVHNCGDEDETYQYDDQSDGYAVTLEIGKNKKKGDWSFTYRYAYIEANCAAGAFNDADFGSVNVKGHRWGAAYNLTDYLTLGGAVYWTEPVTGGTAAHEDRRLVKVQADLIWKF